MHALQLKPIHRCPSSLIRVKRSEPAARRRGNGWEGQSISERQRLSIAEREAELERSNAERDEALARETAIAEVLQVSIPRPAT